MKVSSSKGGWFKLWGKQWLSDEKIRKIGDSGELAYLRMLCYANSLLQQGIFMDNMSNPFSSEHICQAVRITQDQFKILLENDLVIKEDGFFMMKNWDKYQNKNVTNKHKTRQTHTEL